MKETHRSRRSRRTRQLPKSITSDNDDESDLEYQTFQHKSIVRSNKNANRIPTILFDTIQEKQHSSSDQSSLFLYSINSIQKPLAISDDLTPLTITTTNTTPLTALTYSNTKHTERVKIDLSGTDTLDSSPINSDHDQSLSLDRTISSPNLNNKMKNAKDLTQAYDTDTSMKSVVFSKNELSYQKHTSCFNIPSVGNGDCMTIASPSIIEDVSLSTNLNTCQRSPVRWNSQNMTSRFKLFIGCSALSLIVGLVILVIIL